MRVEPKLDSGPILLQRAISIGPEQSSGELHDELARLGGSLLTEALAGMGESAPPELPAGQAQDESLATYAPKLGKADGMLDFSRKARQVHNQARGVTPWPGAQLCFTRLREPGAGGEALAPVRALAEKGLVLENSANPDLQPGTVMPLRNGALPVACADGFYGLTRLKPAGGKSMDAVSFANGYLKNCLARAAAPGAIYLY
jgi:methionyl-tRNA formyltransferase